MNLTFSEIAEITGKTKRTVEKWRADEGMPCTEKKRGKELTCPGTAWLNWYTDREIAKVTGTDYNAERTRLTKEQADKEEMANAVRRGELLEASEVKAGWDDMILAARAKFLALPSRVAPLIQATDGEFNSIKNVIDAGVREALDELSENPTASVGGEMESAAETDS